MTPPLVVAGIDHVVLRCRDPERMLAFYTRVLGLAEERRLEAIGLVQLRAGRSLVDLVPGTPGEMKHANVDHVCLVLESVEMDVVVRWLADEGVETVGEPMVRYGAGGYGHSIYLRDPEGNVIELKVDDHAG
jgi:catechol 2,3-dioxygenase-like lactoylglutathione lyase family enzyme